MGKAFMHRSSKDDCYSTPYSMVWQLLEKEKFHKDDQILEPCSGEGTIVTALYQQGCTNITNYDIKEGFNFFEDKKYYSQIITNPPYRQADQFVAKAKEIYTYKIAMLLRLNYLSGYQRYEAGIFNELSTIYTFTRMSDLRAPIRKDGKYPSAGIVYAWLIWEKGYNGPKIHRWINNQKYILKKGE